MSKEMTIQEIENYINTYRLYPDEYKGKRDSSILRIMNRKYMYDGKDQTITRLEGRINNNGDFELIGLFTFPVGKPEEKVEANGLEFKRLVKGYNRLMLDVGYKEKTIGLEFSGDTAKWNIRDVVAEIEYIRSTFYDRSHDNFKMMYEDPIKHHRLTDRLRHFIRAYKPYIENVKATTTHNSIYD